jgi:sRNA-binding protein
MPEQSCYHFRFKSSYKRLKSARETLQKIFAGRCVRGLAIFHLCAMFAGEEQPLKGGIVQALLTILIKKERLKEYLLAFLAFE